MSRPILPGESDPFLGTRDEIMSSTLQGHITAVNTREGVVSLQIGSGVGARNNVKIPMFQFSFAGTKSSWFRFMPQRGDLVTLTQDMDGSVHIESYECLNYRQLADADEAGQFLFRPLDEGEYEIRSSGMAEIFGSKDGELRLAGGPCSVTLDRASLTAVHDSPLHKMTAVGCELRFGEVRRKTLPTDVEETALAQGVYREFRIVVARSTGVLDTKLVDLAIGDVVDETIPNAPTLSESGLPARAQLKVFDDAGLTEQFKVIVDNAGNLGITQAQLAVLTKLVGLASTLNVQTRSMVFQPSSTFHLGSDSATEPFVLGTALNTFLQALVDTLAGAVIATSMGPASFDASTILQFQQLKAAHLSSDLILSNFAFTQKVPSPGTG